ncbi:MAG: hypothetical protein SFX18_18235 [Pirellulales bacterium]|nr:hypothetical protein [Pirellulales bacterium]
MPSPHGSIYRRLQWGLALGLGVAISVACLSVCSGLQVGGNVLGAEPRDEFLSALKARNWFDVADLYLQKLMSDSQLTPEQIADLQYEQGAILTSKALSSRDLAARDADLAKAQTALSEFVASSPNSEKIPAAKTELARIAFMRGQTLRVKGDKLSPDKRAEPWDQARVQLQLAEKMLQEVDALFVGILKPLSDKLGKGQELNDEEEELKKKFYPSLIFARKLLGETLYEKAHTYPANTKESGDLLEQSTKYYLDLYDKFARKSSQKYPAGYEAATLACRNLLEQKKYDDTLKLAWEVLEQEGIPLVIDRQCLKYAFEAILLGEKSKESWGQIDEVMKTLNLIQRPIEADIAYLAAANAAKNAAAAKDEKEKKDFTNRALKWLRDTMRTRLQHEYYVSARDLYKQLGGKAGGQREDKPYADLLREAGVAIDQYNLAQQDYNQGKDNKEEEPNLKEAVSATREAAKDAVSQALDAATIEAKPDDLAKLRFFLCAVHFESKNYPEAGVLAEMITLNTPQAPIAKNAALIAIESYRLLRQELAELKKQPADAPPPDSESPVTNNKATPAGNAPADVASSANLDKELRGMTRRIRTLADHTIRTWSDSKEADTARMIMLAAAIELNDLPEATKVLAAIPPASPRLAEAQIQLGTTAAVKYLQRKYPTSGEVLDDQDPELQQLRKLIFGGLDQGLAAALKAKSLDQRGVLGAYFLLRLLSRDPAGYAAALPLIDDPDQGLAGKFEKSPEDIPESIKFDLARLVFQAYLSTGNTDGALKMIDRLQAEAAGDPANAQRVRGVLLNGGRELLGQIKKLRGEGNDKRAAELSTALDNLLSKVAAGTADNPPEYATLAWVADSYQQLAGSAAESSDFLTKATEIYQKIIDQGSANPQYANEKQLEVIEVKQIGLLRANGKFPEAYEKLKTKLAAKPTLLVAQKEAAYTLQNWAAATKSGDKEKTKRYVLAANGEPDKAGKPLIWGWNKISRTMYQQKGFRENDAIKDLFFEARYNMARCIFERAAELDKKKQTIEYEKAKTIIRQDMIDIDSRLGGPDRRAEYEDLTKKIQQALGQPTIGLREFQADGAAPEQPAKSTAEKPGNAKTAQTSAK